MKTKKQQHNDWGGARTNSGRPQKQDKDAWGKITCTLRKDTIEKLHDGAGGRFFGEFLQAHLDRYPLPSREYYIALTTHQPIQIKARGKRMPLTISAGAANRIKRPPKPKAQWKEQLDDAFA